MSVRVVITRLPVPEALATEGLPWFRAGSEGIVRGRVAEGAVGAWLDFWGIVRAEEGGRTIEALDYEAHSAMAEHQLTRLAERIAAERGLEALLVIHRIGRVPVGEPSMLVRVWSGHRAEALAGCAELIDELKKWVPIWKHASGDPA